MSTLFGWEKTVQLTLNKLVWEPFQTLFATKMETMHLKEIQVYSVQQNNE